MFRPCHTIPLLAMPSQSIPGRQAARSTNMHKGYTHMYTHHAHTSVHTDTQLESHQSGHTSIWGHTYMQSHTCIYRYIQAHTHHVHVHIHTNTHPYMQTQTLMCMRVLTHQYIQYGNRASTSTYEHTHSHIQAYTTIRPSIHTCIHAFGRHIYNCV